MNKQGKKIAVIVILAVVLLVLVVGLRGYINFVVATKVARNLVATVKSKEYVSDKRIPDYGEWRVYFEIDKFDPADEPLSSRLLDAERRRVGTGKQRFTILSESDYNQTNVGNKLQLKYQQLSGDDIEKLLIW